ncbi:putative tetratricopeptide-like helical domain superfamily [Helianthus annuus]|nr:putative tetratricopeptide-like helical domain superfamily [Helianthus annuus]
MKVYGNLGNLHPKKDNEVLSNGMGNICSKASKVSRKPVNPTSYCRALSTRMDPERLKILGNEDYKNERFAEALALYDAAISIDPEKASYRSTKARR